MLFSLLIIPHNIIVCTYSLTHPKYQLYIKEILINFGRIGNSRYAENIPFLGLRLESK